jgi:hypothetical protein
MRLVLSLLVLSLSQNLLAENGLTSLSLDKESGTAKVCGNVAVLRENEYFNHPDFSGYVIKIYGDNSMFDGLKDTEELCVKGPFQIDSRGFAPHLIITDVEVVAKKDKPSRKRK